MAVKGIKETEKVAVGAMRGAIQTWLEPQLTDISQRLTRLEAHLDGIGLRLDGIDKRAAGVEQHVDMPRKYIEEALRSMRNELEARFETIRSDMKHLDSIAELRERLASVEGKLAQPS